MKKKKTEETEEKRERSPSYLPESVPVLEMHMDYLLINLTSQLQQKLSGAFISIVFVESAFVTELFRELMNIRLKKSRRNMGEDRSISHSEHVSLKLLL